MSQDPGEVNQVPQWEHVRERHIATSIKFISPSRLVIVSSKSTTTNYSQGENNLNSGVVGATLRRSAPVWDLRSKMNNLMTKLTRSLVMSLKMSTRREETEGNTLRKCAALVQSPLIQHRPNKRAVAICKAEWPRFGGVGTETGISQTPALNPHGSSSAHGQMCLWNIPLLSVNRDGGAAARRGTSTGRGDSSEGGGGPTAGGGTSLGRGRSAAA